MPRYASEQESHPIYVGASLFHRIKETLRKKFADLANSFEQRLHAISSELTTIEGPLEVGLVNLLR